MSKSKQFPILVNHNYSQLPVGYLDSNGRIRLRKESGITTQQLVNLNIGYIPKKVEDGIVTEAELVELSMVVADEPNPKTGAKQK